MNTSASEKKEQLDFLLEFQQALKDALKKEREETLAHNKKVFESLTVEFD